MNEQWFEVVAANTPLTQGDLLRDCRVLDWRTAEFTVPRDYLEPLYAQRAKSRLRLRPPYREHLSQAFARFFMRVGLPQAVTLPGQS